MKKSALLLYTFLLLNTTQSFCISGPTIYNPAPSQTIQFADITQGLRSDQHIDWGTSNFNQIAQLELATRVHDFDTASQVMREMDPDTLNTAHFLLLYIYHQTVHNQ